MRRLKTIGVVVIPAGIFSAGFVAEFKQIDYAELKARRAKQ